MTKKSMKSKVRDSANENREDEFPCGKNRGTQMRKQYLRSKSICKVTFRLPRDAAPDAKTVTIVGDFNNWDITENRMRKLKNGDFTLTLELPCNREYKFRYLIDTNRWEQDWFADKHIPGDSETEDSVVVV